MDAREYRFLGGESGGWRVRSINAVIGETLPDVPRLGVYPAMNAPTSSEAKWMLRGITSNERYVTQREKSELALRQPALGRPAATCAALIPIRKTSKWWGLPQDERRAIVEDRSSHIKTGLDYLPAIARRLHHCRDLDETAPFDFLTWFEFAPCDTAAFEDLTSRLRATEEWAFVEREVEIRLSRDA